MRLFQRAFKRSGLHLKHTQGFNPRPSVSIAMPLSVGVESNCELLDFELDGQELSCGEIMERLNQSLIHGVQVLDVYRDFRKIKELELLKCRMHLEYDRVVSDDDMEQISQLFKSETLILDKKGKNGIQQQDIIPLIKTVLLARVDDQTVEMDAIICCQNPSLNPGQLGAAICKYLPHLSPAFIKCRRLELYDGNNVIFR
jgi:radical SAM-linked protein